MGWFTKEWAGRSRLAIVAGVAFGVVLLAAGLLMAPFAWQLAALGGSIYYILLALVLLAGGILYATGRRAGPLLLLAAVVLTVPWALWEAGWNFWPLFARLFALLALLAAGGLVAFGFAGRGIAMVTFALGLVGALAFAVGMFSPKGVIEGDNGMQLVANADGPNDWRSYGQDTSGSRFSGASDITPLNVADLDVAWTYRTGDNGIDELLSEDQNTPLQVGGVLYGCTRNNRVFALDAETGEEIWNFDPAVTPPPLWRRCRSLGYHETAQVSETGEDAQCARRILLATIDNRLIALDARTGEVCTSFGEAGEVDLAHQMGPLKAGYLIPSSGPFIAGDVALIGAWVFDNQEVDQPSGVVRAYDVETGALAWAWDMGAPDRIGAPDEGEIYTLGTPNMWSVPSYDPELGLVYLPMGNQTPDFWGANRTSYAEKYSAAVVALDVSDGRPQWEFRTVLHDVWDYDVPAQPVLVDLPVPGGEVVPALVQVTKVGDIYVLDRRTGEPITQVDYLPAPQGAVEGETLSPVQPRSVGMPTIGNDDLAERDMWGVTPLDQLACRLDFRRSRYEGLFTPVTDEQWTLQFPGYYGGMNWGSASVNTANNYLIVNDIRLGIKLRLVPRDEVDEVVPRQGDHDGIGPQIGTPYAIDRHSFLSPLQIPCQEPPFGTLTAIDLESREIAWQRPMGTVRDTGPFGIPTGLDIPIGMPTIGGSVTTASGLVFFAGTQDNYLRALDVTNGEELWKARLPVGSQATPMTYRTQGGRQFVVISAGGARRSENKGDYLIAYALPEGDSGGE
ncbi:membrane-bound PQQ-dependent dehydrogenase, glucose/quinate/shikimate family [Aurantiacibacter zhengii]|uniref:Membrane-bound PQQ-dependent dehydrogenase, glucose/quinate/shikimate family n=1 Tax=Aurantiacibacter zhengii TaxID=2307003 RepID=A0A418NTS2_9SPHN|nr:membrane-bound PQQ-dependent dehydrogenase, glucose/quinate/shikimate family [Aurantiacibacter zhengii]RIV86813.1 membrane-bound PQQ-dependent dehydrogenase, glucose/quinate/shikimate family [Aurantiacibacter zhengii]